MSAVQCSTVRCSAVQCSAVQCSAVRCSAVQCSALHLTALHRTEVHSAVQRAVECSAEGSEVQYSAVRWVASARARNESVAASECTGSKSLP